MVIKRPQGLHCSSLTASEHSGEFHVIARYLEAFRSKSGCESAHGRRDLSDLLTNNVDGLVYSVVALISR
jgi:hypothetical protein